MVIRRETLKHGTRKLIVVCSVTFLSSDNGGRVTPPMVNGGVYRPLLQLEDVSKLELFGVLLITGPSKIEFGREATVELVPVVYPNPSYDALRPGVLFIIREGEKVVGKGRVLSRGF